MVHTFFFWRCADMTAQAAKALGEEEDAQTYAELAKKTADAFHKKFYNPETGSYGKYGGNIFALKIGVPEAYRDRVVATLKQDILDNGGHFDTGIFGTQFFFEVLAENGLNDLAFEAMNKRDYPSFGLWIAQGATTTWEQWNGENSRNHPMFGGGLTWFYRKLAGMNADPEQPGYKHIIFRPQPVGDITEARYEKLTPYGNASIEWNKQDVRFTMSVVVPVGSTATVYIPTFGNGQSATVDGQGACATFEGTENGYDKYTVSSGRYTFTSDLNPTNGHYLK